MRIALITRSMHGGGTERVAAQLSLLWTHAGHDIVLLTSQPASASDYRHSSVVRETAVGMEWTPESFLAAFERNKFDVAVFNGSWNDRPFKPLVRECKRLGVKVVAILHHAFDNWAFSLSNVGDFDKEDIIPSIDCLVCVDKMQALWWSRRHPCVVCMPNPCGVEEKALASNGRKKRRNGIVWVGRADDWGKRVNLAIEVFDEVRKKIPDAEMTVVGALPKKWDKKHSGIEFTGYVPSATEYIRESTVQLVTTLWEVTVPQVILEANAVGVPTVAFDLPVLRGERGVFLGKDIAEVSDIIVNVLDTPDKFSFSCQSPHSRNEDVEQCWSELFETLLEDNHQGCLKLRVEDYKTVEEYSKLLDEIQRAEAFLVNAQIPLLAKAKRWKARYDRLKRIFGL